MYPFPSVSEKAHEEVFAAAAPVVGGQAWVLYHPVEVHIIQTATLAPFQSSEASMEVSRMSWK